MNKFRYIFLFFSLIVSCHTFGQAIQTNFDSKIIYTDSLNLPRNTSAAVLITLLPELLQRPGNFLLSNYDIQIEGMSVGSAADVALYQMQIVDIEKIRVTESPLSSYKKNGQGGSINLILRSSSSFKNKHWGSVGTALSSSPNVVPQFNIGYKDRKFMLRGILLGEVRNTSSDQQMVNYNAGSFLNQTSVSSDERLRTELARAYMQYNLTDRDMIKLDLSEIYTYSKSADVTDFDAANPLVNRKKSVNFQTHLHYSHTAPRSSFTAQAEYGHAPSWDNYIIPHSYKYRNDVKKNNISGHLEYKNTLFTKVNAAGRKDNAELALGMNLNATFGNETAYIDDERIAGGELVREIPQNDTYYIMPYMTFVTHVGKLAVKAAAEFQHFRYSYDRIGIVYSATSNDFTGKLMAEWHFTESRNLRLILDRKLQRPGADQLYPYRIFSPNRYEYVEGNPDLKPMMVHEAMLDYIGTYKVGDYQSLIFNAGASISRITDIISDKQSSQSNSTGLGYTQKYISFENRGTNNVASANLMALYAYKAFSLSFTGNVYHKILNDNDNHYTYYNVSIFPYFKLNDGWHGGMRVAYFSHIDQSNATLGDCAVADMTVGKAMKRFFIYLTESVSIMSKNKDVTSSGDRRTEKTYNMVPSVVGIGMKYSF